MAVNKSIVRTDSLSTDRINNEFDEDLIVCPICTNILWKPITCKTCENSFCLKCIRLWLNEKANTCPFNCHFQERKCPGILLKLLSKLKIDCENKMNGCTILISYEALEKHQLQECQFRFIQCQNCLKEILSKDFDIHQNELCLQIESTCLKCSTIYYKKDGHTYLQCLKKQSQTIEEAMNSLQKDPRKARESFEKILRLYEREQINIDYATRIQIDNSEQNYIVAPSAPVEEPNSPYQPEPSNSTTPRESLRISTIDFSRIVGSKIEGGYIPNGYAAFNWENAHYMYKEHISKNYRLKGFSNAFKDYQNCVAYNGNGKPLSIFLTNSINKFGLHSFEALSVYHSDYKLLLTGYRSNQAVYIKHIILMYKQPTLFEIDWEQIDKITFTPSITDHILTLEPYTFVLTRLNFIL